MAFFFFLLRFIYFYFGCVCMCVCLCINVHPLVPVPTEVSDALELELRVMCCLMCVLVTKPTSFTRVANAINVCALSPGLAVLSVCLSYLNCICLLCVSVGMVVVHSVCGDQRETMWSILFHIYMGTSSLHSKYLNLLSHLTGSIIAVLKCLHFFFVVSHDIGLGLLICLCFHLGVAYFPF